MLNFFKKSRVWPLAFALARRSFSVVGFCLLPFAFFGQADFQLKAEGFDSHIDLAWPAQTGAKSYKILRSTDGQNFTFLKAASIPGAVDFVGPTAQGQPFFYQIQAIGDFAAVLFSSEKKQAATVAALSDSALLDMVQRATLRYFVELAHPVSGMARERTSSGDVVTSGGTGFGVMAILVGAKRGWLTRAEARDQILKIANFLATADRFHGVFPHWLNGATGKTVPFSALDNGADLVETAFLMQGFLAARQFFDDPNDPKEVALRGLLTQLWEAVEWDWFRKTATGGQLFWHWSPTNGWAMNFQVRGWNEAMIVYLLAIASPTHAVPPSMWTTGWAQSGYANGGQFYGQKLPLGPAWGGPLFFAHYSFLGFDPRGKKDAFCNYFEQNRAHSLINQAWCADNPKNFSGYSADCWGLTASDVPGGYFASAPGNSTDKGTIAPTAALGSMPYSPTESMAALRHFYRQKGAKIWDWAGFRDAFNDSQNWVAADQLAIDQGPIVGMIENFRSGFLWQLFMSNSEIQPALDAIGFAPDVVSTTAFLAEKAAFSIHVFPNPAESELFVEWKKGSRPSFFAADGRAVSPFLLFEKVAEKGSSSSGVFDVSNLAPGLYFLKNEAGAGRFLKH